MNCTFSKDKSHDNEQRNTVSIPKYDRNWSRFSGMVVND